jgi:hypothetical protein
MNIFNTKHSIARAALATVLIGGLAVSQSVKAQEQVSLDKAIALMVAQQSAQVVDQLATQVERSVNEGLANFSIDAAMTVVKQLEQQAPNIELNSQYTVTAKVK